MSDRPRISEPFDWDDYGYPQGHLGSKDGTSSNEVSTPQVLTFHDEIGNLLKQTSLELIQKVGQLNAARITATRIQNEIKWNGYILWT